MLGLIIVFWIVLGVDMLLGFSDELKQVEGLRKVFAIVLLFVGTPFFFVGGLLIEWLDGVMPPGWSDNGFF